MLERQAEDEVQLELWLSLKANLSPLTLDCYYRAGRRLLCWCKENDRLLDQLTTEDMARYWAHLQNPPTHWLADRRVAPANRLPTQLLYGKMASRTLAQEKTLISSLLDGLVELEYIPNNPMKAEPAPPKPEALPRKVLSEDAWSALCAWAGTLPSTAVSLRYAWLIRLFYYTGLRRAEAQGAVMGDFFSLDGQWYLRVAGSRSKIRDITVSDALLKGLQAYRKANGLPALPRTDEDGIPLILPLTGEARHLSTRRINSLIEELALRAGAAVSSPTVREELLRLTPQRFRHASIANRLAKGAAVATVQDEVGHGSPRTTRLYARCEPSARIRDANLL